MICTTPELCIFYMKPNNFRGEACGRINSGKIREGCTNHTPDGPARLVTKQSARASYTRIDDERRRFFRKRVKNGMTVDQVMAITDLKDQTVYRLARKYKIKLGRKEKVKLSDIKKYADRQLTRQEIAIRLGCTATNVGRRAKKAGIDIVREARG